MTAEEILARYRAMYGDEKPKTNAQAWSRLWPTLPATEASDLLLEACRWAEERARMAGAMGAVDLVVLHAVFVGMQLGHIMASLDGLEQEMGDG